VTPITRRILVVTPQLPDPPQWGFAIRVRELVRELSRRHQVTLLSFAWPWQARNVEALRAICESVRTVRPPWPDEENADHAGRMRSLLSGAPYAVRRLTSPAMQRELDDLLAHGDFDLVQIESSLMASLDLSRAPVTILDEHNIEFELLERSLRIEGSLIRKAFNLAEFLKVRRVEKQAWRRFDGCVVTSTRELAEVASAAAGKAAAAVPNGVDLSHFAPQPEGSRSGLVFTGLMSYRPNIDAVTYFVREVLPLIHRTRPEQTFTIVGWGVTDEVRALIGPSVIVTSRVPDVRPYLAGAAAVVAPIRIGSGTRLKVLEALAMARPLISTSLACEGLDLEPGHHLLVADDPTRFAQAVVRVLGDRPLADRLGTAGRQLMEERYGWGAVTAKLEEFHERVIAATGADGSATGLRFAVSSGS
jgi:sugar transferase (PEP-CTERM/EpsH1 system associated)